MSENGQMTNEAPADRAVDKAFTRFMSLAQRARRAVSTSREKPQPTPDQIRYDALHSWLSQSAARDAFIPWLDEMIAVARRNAHLNIGNAAEVTRWLGAEEALSALLDEILRITDSQ